MLIFIQSVGEEKGGPGLLLLKEHDKNTPEFASVF